MRGGVQILPRGDRRVVRLRLTRHAEERMLERGISKDDIASAVANHHTKVSRTDGTTQYVGTVRGLELKAIVDDRVDPIRVITAYFL